MQQIHYSKKGTFNALPGTIFDVVKNTGKYSDFIPWCSRSSIVKPISSQENYTELTITFQKVKQLSYLSHVQIHGENDQLPTYKIQSTCKDEPLKSLVSIWEIEKNSMTEGDIEQTVVNYSIDYEFGSPFLQLTSHLFLNYVGESMWLIFKEQAEKRQRQIDSLRKKSTIDPSINLTFGKSKTFTSQSNSHQQTQPSYQTDLNLLPSKTLAEYLARNPKIHQIYCINKQFKSKLDQWSRILESTRDFEDKLEFKIKNYLIHKS